MPLKTFPPSVLWYWATGIGRCSGVTFDSALWQCSWGELGTIWDVGSSHVPLRARQAVPSILPFNPSLPIIDLFIEMNTEYFADLTSGTRVLIW